MSVIVIKAENLSKRFQLGKSHARTLADQINSLFKKNVRVEKKSSDFIWALRDISFDVKKGEVLGIIGKNGAGKSVLLKILSQITAPTTGTARIKGRVASLLEVGTVFHTELTGRENIFLNGAILGMTKSEIKRKFDEIVDFSGVPQFIDTPVKHYSSGMKVRLGFAVAAHLEPEILIVDEVLAVGDAEFQKKCLGKMKDVAGEGRTVLFVSHNLSAVRDLCTTGILLEKGNLKFSGQIREVIENYLETDSDMTATGIVPDNYIRSWGTLDAKIRKISLLSLNSLPLKELMFKQKFKVRIEFEVMKKIEKAFFSLEVSSNDSTVVSQTDSLSFTGNTCSFEKGHHHVEVQVNDALMPLAFSLNAGMHFQTVHPSIMLSEDMTFMS